MPPIGQPQVEIGLRSHDEKGGGVIHSDKEKKNWYTGGFVVGDTYCPLVVIRLAEHPPQVLHGCLRVCPATKYDPVIGVNRVSLKWGLLPCHIFIPTLKCFTLCH